MQPSGPKKWSRCCCFFGFFFCLCVMYLSLKFEGKVSRDRRAKDYTCLIHTWPASMSQIDGADIH